MCKACPEKKAGFTHYRLLMSNLQDRNSRTRKCNPLDDIRHSPIHFSD